MKPLSFKINYNNNNFFSIILVSKGVIPSEINSKVYRLPIQNSLNNNEKAVFLLEYPFSDKSFNSFSESEYTTDSYYENYDIYPENINSSLSSNNFYQESNKNLLPLEDLDPDILKEIYSQENIDDLLNFDIDDIDEIDKENCFIDFDEYHSFNISDYSNSNLSNQKDTLNNFNNPNEPIKFYSSFSELDPIDYNDSISILCNLIIEYLNREYSFTNKEITTMFNNLYEIIDKSIYETIINF
ncbi:hypothetical protein V6O07_04595 [Arthrospira platensis SPKY2]